MQPRSASNSGLREHARLRKKGSTAQSIAVGVRSTFPQMDTHPAEGISI